MANTKAGEIFVEIMAGMEAEKETVKAEVDQTARDAAEYARGIAPVYHGPARRDVVPGAFRDSIISEDAPEHDGMPAARVSSYSRIAHLLEFGTSRMHEFATFANTAVRFGGTGPDRGDEEGGGIL